MEMGNIFKFIDKVTDKFKQSLVLYRINYSQCSSAYIGKTERIMGYRNKETRCENSRQNTPYKHSVITGHTVDYEGIEIKNRASPNFKLCIKPHIVEDKPRRVPKS